MAARRAGVPLPAPLRVPPASHRLSALAFSRSTGRLQIRRSRRMHQQVMVDRSIGHSSSILTSHHRSGRAVDLPVCVQGVCAHARSAGAQSGSLACGYAGEQFTFRSSAYRRRLGSATFRSSVQSPYVSLVTLRPSSRGCRCTTRPRCD